MKPKRIAIPVLNMREVLVDFDLDLGDGVTDHLENVDVTRDISIQLQLS